VPTKPPKRRPRKAVLKDQNILIRVTAEQKRALVAAAERAGLELSSWLRALGLREAQRTGASEDVGGVEHAGETGERKPA
jgi:uncharacterized protein (DUF1778 family)